MKGNKGILQVGLVIAIASLFAAALLLTKLNNLAKVATSEADSCTENGAIDCSDAHRECGQHDGCRWAPIGNTRVQNGTCPGSCVRNVVNPPTASPTESPVATPTETPVITPTPTQTPVPTETPVPSGTPNFCGGTCGSNFNCQSGLFCFQGFCRNPVCPNDSTCGCATTPGPTQTPIGSGQTPPPVVLGASTPPQLPATGANDVEILLSLAGIAGLGFYLFRRFKLI